MRRSRIVHEVLGEEETEEAGGGGGAVSQQPGEGEGSTGQVVAAATATVDAAAASAQGDAIAAEVAADLYTGAAMEIQEANARQGRQDDEESQKDKRTEVPYPCSSTWTSCWADKGWDGASRANAAPLSPSAALAVEEGVTVGEKELTEAQGHSWLVIMQRGVTRLSGVLAWLQGTSQ